MTDAQAIHELAQAGLAEPVADESFDRFARLVRRQLGVPSALVTLVLDDEAVLPGALGLPEPYQSERRTPLSHTFCQFVTSDSRPLVVEDARVVPRLAALRAVDDIGVVSYAGFPIFDPHGRAVGSLCAFDGRPRPWSDEDLATLADLAAACTSELRLRLARARAKRMQRVALAANRRSRLLLELSESFAAATSVRDVAERLSAVGTGIGARYAGLAVLDASGTRLEYTTLDHLEPGVPASFRRMRVDAERGASIAARTREPLFFRDHAQYAARLPEAAALIASDGVEARAFLPVLAGERLLGVVTLAWEAAREFDDDAVQTKTAIASYVAHALDRVRLLEERHRVATTLQAAMLTELPSVRSAELAATYASATRTDQVGGDWYDAVVLDDDACVLMIGDVTGHDMRAAAQMGQLRSMLRTFAWCQDEPPAVLLRLLDRANRGLALHSSGTAVVARLDRTPHGFDLTWSNAGHPAPLVLRADGSVETLDAPADLMLGVLPGTTRHDHRARLAHGDTLLLYTDGLVERRGTSYAERLAAARAALAEHTTTATSALPDALVRRLVSDQRDDVAVLALRVRHTVARPPGPGRPSAVARQVEHGSWAIGPGRRWVDDVLESCDVSPSVRRIAMLLTSEVLTNAVQHGAAPVEAELEVGHRVLRVAVRDGSATLPRLRTPRPDETGGRGVQFLERCASRWGVDALDGAPGKTVWFELDLDD
ncbi:SpoIIE family protein phosphatase [Cellulosimicrobium cellulans]|uniref:SpoIIE family protein phosphatase n=1 Tax=Cellulosimicrobium cellulans TaxID=1710 RepID=UPI0024069F8B|nr:SpoIIE family protein phosphatase [Cellulosimicrobium cellulans]MDF9876010.1 serine phosphatase RsbU (regulator of sigma subunit)/anti-sigma regulatory factor (Ser/Thr protein kinase) [Cellulosimicrobium cellulans]